MSDTQYCQDKSCSGYGGALVGGVCPGELGRSSQAFSHMTEKLEEALVEAHLTIAQLKSEIESQASSYRSMLYNLMGE